MTPYSVRCCGLLLLIFLYGTQNATAADLRWKFAVGDKWNVTIKADTSSVSTLNTKTLRTKLETTVETQWTIDEVQGDTAHITQQILRLRLTGTGVDGVGILYDSSATEKPVGPAKEIAAAVAPYVGAIVQCKMNERGEISEVVLSGELAKLNAADESSAGHPFALDLLQQPLCLVPGKEVAADATWDHERKLKLTAGEFQESQNFTLTAEEGANPPPEGQVRITSAADLKPIDTAKKSPLQTQERSGVYFFDPQAGRLSRSKVTLKLTLANPFRDQQIVVKTTSIREVEVTAAK